MAPLAMTARGDGDTGPELGMVLTPLCDGPSAPAPVARFQHEDDFLGTGLEVASMTRSMERPEPEPARRFPVDASMRISD